MFRSLALVIALAASLWIPSTQAPALAASMQTTSATYTITNLGTLGGALCAGFTSENSFATGLNSAGEVVGGSCVLRDFVRSTHAFRYSAGMMREVGTGGVANGINSAGRIVGSTSASSGFDPGGRAFLYQDGVISYPLPPALFSQAFAINERDQIVGLMSYQGRFDAWRAVLYSGGTTIDLGTLGGTFRSAALAINDLGHVVGYASTTGDNASHAFLYTDGTMRDLGTLGGAHSFARDINATDHVVGASWTGAGETHAFLYRDGGMTDLGTLGGSFSSALGINDSGSVVGSAGTASSGQHAFLYRDGAMTDLNDLIPSGSGWVLTEARAINNSGQIAGTGQIGGEPRAFLLTPAGDSTPPLIAVAQSPAANASGWNNADVQLTWTVSDPESGIATSSCVSETLIAESAGTIRTCMATNGAGLSAARSVTIRIDRTMPELSFAGAAATYAVDQTIVVTCTATDALSGLATVNCPSVTTAAYNLALGSHTLTASATDYAGNSNSRSVSFQVVVTYSSLCDLTTVFEKNANLARALCKILDVAKAADARGNERAKTTAIRAYIQVVRGQSGKTLTSDQANTLATLAENL